MNIHFSYKNSERTPDVEQIIERRVEKLRKLLRVYAPELVHLHGSVELQSPKEGFVVSLNLRLPTGQVHASEGNRHAASSLRAAFDEMERQLHKHKELLRREDQWKRRRPRNFRGGEEHPSEGYWPWPRR